MFLVAATEVAKVACRYVAIGTYLAIHTYTIPRYIMATLPNLTLGISIRLGAMATIEMPDQLPAVPVASNETIPLIHYTQSHDVYPVLYR